MLKATRIVGGYVNYLAPMLLKSKKFKWAPTSKWLFGYDILVAITITIISLNLGEENAC